jgi:cation diffusion facilitator family transporter
MSGGSVIRWGWYSVAVNVFLVTVHGSIAVASGSLAVAAELVHNVVDLLTAVAVLLGVRLATRKTQEFPYGLYKLENLVAAGLGVMTFLTAYEVARSAVAGTPGPARAEAWMLGAVVVTGVIPLVFARFELRAGRACNSPAIVAEAIEYRVHVLTTGLALASLISIRIGIPVDRGAALVIVVVVVKTGWSLLRDAMRVLLDASLDAETLLRVRSVIAADPAVAEVKWVTGRNAGRFRFVEAGVALRTPDVEKARVAMTRVETSVRSAVEFLDRVLLQVEAPATMFVRYAVPLADVQGSLSRHFGEAPYFALVDVRREDGALAEQRIVANPHRLQERGKGIQVAEWLVSQRVDVALVTEDLHGKGPEYVFRDAGVVLRRTDATTVGGAIAVGHAPPDRELSPPETSGSP